MSYRVTAAFLKSDSDVWTTRTWTTREPNLETAIRERARTLGAVSWDVHTASRVAA